MPLPANILTLRSWRQTAGWLGKIAALWLVMAAGLRAQTKNDGDFRWRSALGAQTESSPAIGADGTIYIGAAQDRVGYLVAVQPDGNNKWSRQIPAAVFGSPAVAPDGTIYIGADDGQLYAYTPDGTRKWAWSSPTSTIVDCTPAIGADGTIYFGSWDGNLYAINPDKTQKWAFPTGDIIHSSPAIGIDGTIYVGSKDHNLYAVNPADGSQKWAFPTQGEIWSSPAIGIGETIFIGSNDQQLYSVDSEGHKRWSFPTNGSIQTSPVLGADSTIYFASADTNFYAVTPDGQQKWKIALNSTGLSSGAVRADGTIIVAGDNGAVHALKPTDGSEKWPKPYTLPIQAAINSSPVVGPDGTIYFGAYDRYLYALYGDGSPLSTYSSWPMLHRDIVHTGRFVPSSTGAQLINLSTRASAGNNIGLTAGFVTKGTAPKYYLIRGIGPGLTQFGLNNPLLDPTLTLYASPPAAPIAFNDNWPASAGPAGPSLAVAMAAAGAFPLTDGSKDSVMLPVLSPGGYTAVIGAADNGTGVALVEVYDPLPNNSESHLINLSTLAQVGTGANVLTPGLVVGGTGSMRVLVRAVGPGLIPFGVTGTVARTSLTAFSNAAGTLRTNAGWTSDGFQGDIAGAGLYAGAFPFADGSADSAMILTLTPGDYTFQVTGTNGATGTALVEVYALP